MATSQNQLQKLKELAQTNPEEAIKLLQSVQAKNLDPHPAQQQVLDSQARFKVLNAGRRFGKTQLGAKSVLREARDPNKVIWWVAPTNRVVKRGYNSVLEQLPQETLSHSPPSETLFDSGRAVILKFKNGTRMEFYSAERPEGMLGEGVDYALVDEAAIIKGNIFNQTIRPTLMDKGGKALMISTPRGHNWFYRAYNRGQDPGESEWDSWTFTSEDNPYIDPKEIQDIAEDLPQHLYEQEVLAKFVAAGSSVFMWDSAVVQKQRIKNSNLIEGEDFNGQHIVLGIDLAKRHDWTVIYGASAETFRNVYFERLNKVRWSEQKRRIRRAAAILDKAGASGVTLIVDQGNVGDAIIDDLEDYGLDVVGVNFTGAKNNMVMNFAKDLEESKAFILEEGIEEFSAYQMKMTSGGKIRYGAPEGQHDDIVSAKILQHHGLVNEGVPGVQSISPVGPAPEPEEENPYADVEDLLDPEDMEDLQLRDYKETIQLHKEAANPPSPLELMLRDEVWSSYEG